MSFDRQQLKIDELTRLLPEAVRDAACWIKDGDYVWLNFSRTIEYEYALQVLQIMKNHQGHFTSEPVSGKLMYQFPLNPPPTTVETDEAKPFKPKPGEIIKPPIQDFKERDQKEKQEAKNKQQTQQDQPVVVEPVKTSKLIPHPLEPELDPQTLRPKPKRITAMGDYAALFCSTCIKINVEQVPCSEQNECAALKVPLILEKQVLLSEKQISLNEKQNLLLEKILEQLQQQATALITIFNKLTTLDTLTTPKKEPPPPNNPPPQPTQTTTATTPPPTQPQQQPTTTATSPPQQQQQQNSKNNNSSRSKVGKKVDMGIVWTDALNKDGGYYQKALEEDNITNGALTSEYSELLAKVAAGNRVYENGYSFWHFNEANKFWNANCKRFIGRKKGDR